MTGRALGPASSPSISSVLPLAYPPQGPHTPAHVWPPWREDRALPWAVSMTDGAAPGWPAGRGPGHAVCNQQEMGPRCCCAGLGVSLPMYGKRRLAVVSWSEFPGLHSWGRQCGRKEAILGGADKPAHPHRKGGPYPSFPGNGGPSLTQSTCGGRRRGKLAGLATHSPRTPAKPSSPLSLLGQGREWDLLPVPQGYRWAESRGKSTLNTHWKD